MNEALQQWFEACMNAPGILGAGLMRPDGSSVCRSTDETFPDTKVERVMELLAQLQPELTSVISSPRWSTWQFEQGKIRCVSRPDGWLLGLAVRPETEAANNLNKISDAFLALDLSAANGNI
jgi:hypothetical protein